MWQDPFPWNIVITKQRNKIDLYAFWSPTYAMGRKRNLLWISEVLLENKFLLLCATLNSLLFHKTAALACPQPPAESTRPSLQQHFTKALMFLRNQNWHNDKLPLERRPGKPSLPGHQAMCPRTWGPRYFPPPSAGSENIPVDLWVTLSKYKIYIVPATFIILIPLKEALPKANVHGQMGLQILMISYSLKGV